MEILLDLLVGLIAALLTVKDSFQRETFRLCLVDLNMCIDDGHCGVHPFPCRIIEVAAPVVDAGPDLGIAAGVGVELEGSVADDGLPAGATVRIHDPLALPEQARSEYGLELMALEELGPADAVVLAVAHRAFREGGWDLVQGILRDGVGQVADVRAILDKARIPAGCRLWRL